MRTAARRSAIFAALLLLSAAASGCASAPSRSATPSSPPQASLDTGLALVKLTDDTGALIGSDVTVFEKRAVRCDPTHGEGVQFIYRTHLKAPADVTPQAVAEDIVQYWASLGFDVHDTFSSEHVVTTGTTFHHRGVPASEDIEYLHLLYFSEDRGDPAAFQVEGTSTCVAGEPQDFADF